MNQRIKSGLAHHRKGCLEAAMADYEAILSCFPDHPDALHLSGLVAHQQGNSDDAILRIRQAVHHRPASRVFRKNLCSVLLTSGKWTEGLKCCTEFLNDFPGSVDMLVLLGGFYMDRGYYAMAVDCFQQANDLDPCNAEVQHNLGVAFQYMGRLDQALGRYRQALQLNPGLAEAHYNAANAMRIGGAQSDEIILAYRRALAIKPDYVDAIFNLAKTLDELERSDEAVDAYRNALKIKPDFVEAHNCLGNTHLKLRQFQAAAACYAEAVRIQPDFHQGYYNLALVFKMQDRLDEALCFVRQSLQLKPNFGDAASLLVQILQQACAWEELEKAGRTLDMTTDDDLAADRCPAEQPFLNFTRNADPALNLRIARAWSEAVEARLPLVRTSLVNNPTHRKSDKIVVAYVSERFRNAATAHLIRQLFGLHDRHRFAVYAYSYGKDDGSVYRQCIEQDADRFVDIRHLSDHDAAQCIRNDGVDILVDLMGYMKHNRFGIFAWRPAPIQVEYLGYPSTTGARFMDYLIGDCVVTPDGEEAHYSECIVRMPHCYQMNDSAQTVSCKTFHRREFGLPEDAFVYCSFNTDYKIDRSTFTSWMNILKQIPSSVLWLLIRSSATRRNLNNAAERAGVDTARLVFAQSLPKHEHLSRLKLADLALDTFTVNGHTTTSDCLWMDLPVVAVRGTHFASRVSASLLSAAGLPEMVCGNIDEYEALAVELAENRDHLTQIRKKLSTGKRTAPLFDSARTVFNLESAYLRMWDNHLMGRSPQSFSVEEPASSTANGGHQ